MAGEARDSGDHAAQLRLDVGAMGGATEGYRGPTVCKIVGITYRQLDYWARTGLVNPSVRQAEGSGTQRLYSFDDIVQLRVVKRLLDTGVSLQRVRLAIDELRDRGRSPSDVTLVCDGTSVFMVDDNAQVIDLLPRARACSRSRSARSSTSCGARSRPSRPSPPSRSRSTATTASQALGG